MSSLLGKTHLEFYKKHNISPVNYDINNLDAHLERRSSLYMKLGLTPLTFKSANILEVAAGVGQNSLYLASLLPKQLVLLEPNPKGIEEIQKVYQSFPKQHTVPQINTSMLEDYDPNQKFDIVLCENWLGNSEHEISLLKKLSKMIVKNGILVITTVSPIGFVPNLLRRFLASYAAPYSESFETRTTKLIDFFGPHLDSLQSMTRNKTDWVQDNMINPAYFGLCLSIPEVLQKLKDDYEILGSSPSFAEDWRWFKSLYSDNKMMNEHFLQEYWSKAHNFLDHREPITRRDPLLNQKLEKSALSLLFAIEEHENCHAVGKNPTKSITQVTENLNEFISLIPTQLEKAIAGLNEINNRINNIDTIRSMPKYDNFSSLFGRETIYISLLKTT